MPVIDASVLVAHLAREDRAEVADEHLERERDDLYAPHLIDAEVGHVLRRHVIAGRLGEADARSALSGLADLPLLRAEHEWLLETAWELHSKLSFYDALYVALAIELETELLTFDARLARGARGLSAKVVAL